LAKCCGQQKEQGQDRLHDPYGLPDAPGKRQISPRRMALRSPAHTTLHRFRHRHSAKHVDVDNRIVDRSLNHYSY
jgi:hypothetical protein